MLAVVTVAAVAIFNARQLALADGASGAVRFVSSAEAALNRSLLGVDVLLASMDGILDLSAVRAEWLDPEVTSQRLRSSARQSLMVRYVAGRWQGRAFGFVRRRRCCGGRVVAAGFARSVFEQPLPMLMVSAPAVSFVSAGVYLSGPAASAG